MVDSWAVCEKFHKAVCDATDRLSGVKLGKLGGVGQGGDVEFRKGNRQQAAGNSGREGEKCHTWGSGISSNDHSVGYVAQGMAALLRCQLYGTYAAKATRKRSESSDPAGAVPIKRHFSTGCAGFAGSSPQQ